MYYGIVYVEGCDFIHTKVIQVKPLDELLGWERFYPIDAILCPVLYTLVVCYIVLKLSLNYLIASCFHKSFIMVPGKYTMKFIKMETLGTIFLSSEYTDVRDYKCYSCMIPDIMTIFDVRCKQESDVYMLQFIYVAMYNYETIIYGYLNRYHNELHFLTASYF